MSAPGFTPTDIAYAERNQCVALIARMAFALGLRVGVHQHPAEDTSWEEDWRTLVLIDLPTGQVSWRFHDSERPLLEGLPEYFGAWDGHDTPTKYERVRVAFEPSEPRLSYVERARLMERRRIAGFWDNTEARAAEAHAVYQKEAHRRGDVRHPDEYAALSEATKEWDRVLVRWVADTIMCRGGRP